MRTRKIRPGFFKSENVADLPIAARLYFIGLWCAADRDGRLEYRPKRLKAEIFPYDNVDIEKLTDVITCNGFAVKYEVNAKQYLFINNFVKYQDPHPHEAKSQIPPYVITSNVMSVTSRVIIPRAVDSVVSVTSVDSVTSPAVTSNDIPAGAFDVIWSHYPRPDGKKEAERHFKASVKTKKDWLDINAALRAYLNHLNKTHTESKFIKMGSTWFNNWKDWVDMEEKNAANNGGKGSSEYAAISRAAREAAGLGKIGEGSERALLDRIRNRTDVPSETKNGD